MDNSVSAFLTIQQSLGLEGIVEPQSVTTQSPLFISIDLEYTQKAITQLGVSVFDPQSLNLPDLAEPAIRSTWYSTDVSQYSARRRKRFQFGERQTLRKNEIPALLVRILSPTDHLGLPISRDIILIGHVVSNDIGVIKRLHNLDISRLPTIKATLDTERIAYHILNPPSRLSLKRLLQTLQLEYIGLHNAGNDSRYTLRALLLMFCMPPQSSTNSLSMDAARRSALLKGIATSHEPRKRSLWCENSPRTKFDGNPDLLDQDWPNDGDIGDSLLDVLPL